MLVDHLFCLQKEDFLLSAKLPKLLPCILVKCDKTDRTTHKQVFLTVFKLLYFPVITHLLDGPEDEVTPDIRRRA